MRKLLPASSTNSLDGEGDSVPSRRRSSSSSSARPAPPGLKSSRKASRVKFACAECQKRKRKCDGRNPICGPCAASQNHEDQCIYTKSLQERHDSLESDVVRLSVEVDTLLAENQRLRNLVQSSTVPGELAIPSAQQHVLWRPYVVHPSQAMLSDSMAHAPDWYGFSQTIPNFVHHDGITHTSNQLNGDLSADQRLLQDHLPVWARQP